MIQMLSAPLMVRITAGQWVSRGGFSIAARSLPSHDTMKLIGVSEDLMKPTSNGCPCGFGGEWGDRAALVNYICHGSANGWHWNNSGTPF